MRDTHVEVRIGDVLFPLKEFHDFCWIQAKGRVFKVFAQQDSGNISFGVETSDGGRKFIKYAGARTMAYEGIPDEAIARLRQAVSLYDTLQHHALIKLLNHYPVGNGYAAEFEWFEGENLHPHEAYPPPAKYIHPDSPHFRFKQLPVAQRLKALNDIFDFHVLVEQSGYVAVDFYDGSILYDFIQQQVRVCDIDMYQLKPFSNTMGRLWGSSRFMSPEEFELGAPIDSVTNVFNMAAIAFGLLGGERDRSLEKWDAGEDLYRIALRAVNPQRVERYTNVKEFVSYWSQACRRASDGEYRRRFSEARCKEIDYHTQFYGETELFQLGSWLSKPVKSVMDALELLESKELQVLDLGCGVGRNSIPIAQRIMDRGGRVVCVDLLPEAIDKLRVNADQYEVAHLIEGYTADVESYDVPRNTFDFIVACSVLEHMSSEEAFISKLEQLKEAVKDEGIICLLINTDVKEIDAITGEEEAGLIELNLPTERTLILLRHHFSTWDTLKESHVQQEIPEIKLGRKVIFRSEWVTYIARNVML